MRDATGRQWWDGVRDDVRAVSLRMSRHRVSVAAGGMAFFTALAIAPAAIAFGTVAGLVLEPATVQSALESLIARNPALEPLAGVVEPIVGVVTSASSRGFTIASVGGLVVALVAASRVVVSMRQSLDDAFGVVDHRSGLLQRAVGTLIAFVGIVLGVVLVSAVTVLPRVLGGLGVSAGLLAAMPLLGYAVVLLLAYPLIWALYRRGPHRGVRLGFWSLGAGVATLGVVAASAGVGVYVQLSSTVSATLAVFGAPMVVLLWLYFVALALLVGAELAAVRLGTFGSEGPDRQVTVSQRS